MMGRNICFKGVIWNIIPKLSLLTLLIWSSVFLYRSYGTSSGNADHMLDKQETETKT